MVFEGTKNLSTMHVYTTSYSIKLYAKKFHHRREKGKNFIVIRYITLNTVLVVSMTESAESEIKRS